MTAHSLRPCISLPSALVLLYRAHAARLPPLSEACAAGVRAALTGLEGVTLPETPPPARTLKATQAAARKRVEGRSPPCPRCHSSETEPLRNFGRVVPGRFQCLACRRWFGPENPPDAGGTGSE